MTDFNDFFSVVFFFFLPIFADLPQNGQIPPSGGFTQLFFQHIFLIFYEVIGYKSCPYPVL